MAKGKIVACIACGKERYRYPSELKRNYRYCSRKCWYNQIKGENNPHYGKRHTQKTKDKMSKKMSGRKLSKEHIEKIKYWSRKNARYGPANNLWKGGVSSKRNRIGNSKEWKEWREKVYERDGHQCRKCKKIGGKLNPHHIMNVAQHEELTFKVSNGITFCQECHRQFHKQYGKKDNNLDQVKEFIKT